MPPRKLLRAFLALWIVTGVALFVGGVETAGAALGSARHANPHVALLGVMEAVAATIFLVPRAMRVGGVGLVGTILVALIVHTMLGEFRGDLLLYAATVVFVTVHGPLTRQQLLAAISWRPSNER